MSGEDGSFRPFKSVAIVGVGLIGGSLGQAIRSRGLAREVVGIGRSPEKLQRAIELQAIDRYVVDISEGLRGADLVVLCTPVGTILKTLPGILLARESGAIVTDVGSTKSAVTDCSGSDPLFVGSHPMTGSEHAGVESASPDLFVSATWAITPTDRTSPAAAFRIEQLAGAIGAHVLSLSPKTHDAIVAVTSHLPHVMASALALQAGDLRTEYPFAPAMSAGSFADATRVAVSHPELWRDICMTNREEIVGALIDFREQMDRAISFIEAGNANGLEEFFRAGGEAKQAWKKNGP